MLLRDLVTEESVFEARFAAREIGGITADSRSVKRGDLFVAVPGTKTDGLRFVPQALAAGAAASWPSVSRRRSRRTLPS